MESIDQRLGMGKQDFALIVKKFRKDAGYTQEDLAAYVGGVTLNTICNWENGYTVPRNRIVIQRLRQVGVLR